MAALKALLSNMLGKGPSTPMESLFDKTHADVDGEECLHDCSSCSVAYPRGWKVDEDDAVYGQIKGWSRHVVIGTGKTDWVRDVADERGSVMEALRDVTEKQTSAEKQNQGRLMVSASDMPMMGEGGGSATRVLVLPAFWEVRNVRRDHVAALMRVVNAGPTTTSPLHSSPPVKMEMEMEVEAELDVRQCPHDAIILMCSQKTRDARCGQSAPLLRRELERHLRPLGLLRDADDERPGGVGIFFISHVGGHKYAANVIVYRRQHAFTPPRDAPREQGGGDGGAAQCIWLARIRPEDCENLVRYTVLQGKVVKPERQLRGGFDRSRGLCSW